MVVRLTPADRDEQIRLLCFPYGGGNAGSFRSWIADMPPGVGLYSINLPGRGPRYRERNFTRMEELVSAVYAAVLPLLDRRFVLFGHSLGARIAFAIAERLRSDGLAAPQLLAAAASLPPDRRRARDVSGMSDGELLAYLKDLGGTPPEVLENADLMAISSGPLRADFLLAQQTLPVSGLLDCPLLVLGGDEDRDVGYEDLRHWQRVTRGPFCLGMFPGNHFFVQTNSRAVIDLLLDHVAQ